MNYQGDLVIQWAEWNQLVLNVAKTKSIAIESYYYINWLLGAGRTCHSSLQEV